MPTSMRYRLKIRDIDHKVVPMSIGYERELNRIIDDCYSRSGKLGMTWRDLADAAGLHPRTIYRLGNRITKLPRFETVWKIAKAVGMELALVQRKARRKAA